MRHLQEEESPMSVHPVPTISVQFYDGPGTGDSAEMPANRCTNSLASHIDCTHARLGHKAAERSESPSPSQSLKTGREHVAAILSTSSYVPPHDSNAVHQILVAVALYARSLEDRLVPDQLPTSLPKPLPDPNSLALEDFPSPQLFEPGPLVDVEEHFRNTLGRSIHFVKSAMRLIDGDASYVVGVQRPHFWTAQPWEKLAVETPHHTSPQNDLLKCLSSKINLGQRAPPRPSDSNVARLRPGVSTHTGPSLRRSTASALLLLRATSVVHISSTAASASASSSLSLPLFPTLKSRPLTPSLSYLRRGAGAPRINPSLVRARRESRTALPTEKEIALVQSARLTNESSGACAARFNADVGLDLGLAGGARTHPRRQRYWSIGDILSTEPDGVHVVVQQLQQLLHERISGATDYPSPGLFVCSTSPLSDFSLTPTPTPSATTGHLAHPCSPWQRA
ncbi:hypothetical protein C8R47DRAFT_1330203 [Mycena vitilis]|nr:hypothetical protein C8R47DRAFT_1330203 [Mycena vitilis]